MCLAVAIDREFCRPGLRGLQLLSPAPRNQLAWEDETGIPIEARAFDLPALAYAVSAAAGICPPAPTAARESW